jgi:hypothetical protein
LTVAAAVLALAALLVAGGGLALFQAARQVPDFYPRALEADTAAQRVASDEMLQKAAALASDLKREGSWRALFTAEEINGWLAVDLVENYPGALPESVSDPRVAIAPDQLTLACRLDRGDWQCVVSLLVEVYLAEPNVLALRIRQARAGVIPLPLDEVVQQITRAASRMDLKLEWRQAGGDPVALLSIRSPKNADGKLLRIELLELADGEIYLSGSSSMKAEAEQGDAADGSVDLAQ